MSKILVVDDDDLIRGMVSTILKKLGYEVVEAVNGTQGVEKAKTENPDLVITDILMPDKEGIETIIELRSINKDIKIIAMSGGGGTKNMSFLDMAKNVGANEIMMKPFKPNDIEDKIKALIG